jgi:magnesium transporter
MPRLMKSKSKKIGLAPGTLIHIGRKKIENATITAINYNEKKIETKELKEVKEFFKINKKDSTTWLNITGLHETSIIEDIGKAFKIHSLVLEDIMNTDQRPKFEDYDEYLFIVLKILSYDAKTNNVITEQISILLSQEYVITFQENENRIFSPIIEKLNVEKSKLRIYGTDYLAYRLLDIIIDNYFLVLEKIGERIEFFEEELINEGKQDSLKEIYKIKRENILLRKSVWPLREVISKIERTDSEIITTRSNVYLRDLHDHTIQVIDTLETYRDMTTSMIDLHLSNTSNKMNEIMKVLTIIATIFIPLTFIAGVYGMNFNNMPELHMKYGYYATWGIMIFIGGLMVYYFKKKDWI